VPQRYIKPSEERQCSAKSKQSQKRCRRWAAPGKTKCIIHGGRVRMSSKQMRGGRYSKVLKGLKDRYIEALEDDRLFDLRETLAIMDTALMEQLEQAEQGATPQSWADAYTKLREFHQATSVNDSTTAALRLNELHGILKSGAQRSKAMEKVVAAAERKARRTEAAWRVRLDAQQVVNVRDLVAIFTRMTFLIEDECGAAEARNVIERMDTELFGGMLTETTRNVSLKATPKTLRHK